MDIRPCTLAEIEACPNLGDVLAEYARESAVPEFGEAHPQFDIYHAAEACGMMRPVGAFDDQWCAGFILPVVVKLPHYGSVAAIVEVESFFVPVAYRPQGVGLSLLSVAEGLAREAGAFGMLVTAPAGGVLSQVMRRRSGFRHSGEVFVKALLPEGAH